MVLVKTLVYHTLGTLMPYPSEDPPRLLKASLPDKRPFMHLAFSGLISLPVGREASIASLKNGGILLTLHQYSALFWFPTISEVDSLKAPPKNGKRPQQVDQFSKKLADSYGILVIR
jgi:hypothetical protein